jgi:NTP pyrophosphatase (non-canonical NTP hydrolase)
LGIAGEVGEFVNLVKKFNRSDTGLIDRQAASQELADIAIYLLDICHTLDIDLEEAIEMKRKILIARWGDPDR